jgi:hypothetical protein
LICGFATPFEYNSDGDVPPPPPFKKERELVFVMFYSLRPKNKSIQNLSKKQIILPYLESACARELVFVTFYSLCKKKSF